MQRETKGESTIKAFQIVSTPYACHAGVRVCVRKLRATTHSTKKSRSQVLSRAFKKA